MERFNDELVLTTSQVGDLLSVHPSTVKRWSDGGGLPAVRTGGGHRRIHLQDALQAASERGIETYLDRFAPYQGHVWSAVTEAELRGSFRKAHAVAMGWLMRGYLDRVGWLFRELGRRSAIPFPVYCDDGVRAFVRRVADARRQGRIGSGDERLAGQTLMETLLGLRRDGEPEGAWRERHGPGATALVGSVKGDPHSVGSLCARLLLERHGWTVLYLGPEVSVEDLALLYRSRAAELACIACSDPDVGIDVARRVQALLGGRGAGRCWALVLGGNGDAGCPPPGISTDDSRVPCVSTVTDLDDALDAVLDVGPSLAGTGP